MKLKIAMHSGHILNHLTVNGTLCFGATTLFTIIPPLNQLDNKTPYKVKFNNSFIFKILLYSSNFGLAKI